MAVEQIALLQLRPGTKGRIFQLNRLSPLLRSRLSDLGVEEGMDVMLKRRLPFGGPITIEASGQLIGIRQDDAARIGVLPL